MKVLEVGTGWAHFYGLLLRLFYDIEVTLVDIIDNRQLSAMKRYFSDFSPLLEGCFEIAPDELERTHRVLEIIKNVDSFDELYSKLGLRYSIDPSSTLDPFPSEYFDVVVSIDVLEHIPIDTTSAMLDNVFRVLKPDGFQIHQIVIGDHLIQYDPKVSAKNYLRYTNRCWKSLFENQLQYINRIQASEWRTMFTQRGGTIISEKIARTRVDGLEISKDFSHYSKDDLETTVLMMLIKR